MIEKICRNLENKLGEIYVDKIVKNDTYYLVYLTDFLGMNVDKIPYRFDNRTGDEVGRLNIDYDYTKDGCDIPLKYRSGRRLVIDEILVNDGGEDGDYKFDGVTLEELNLWLDIMYSLIDEKIDASLLYALSDYYVGIVNSMITDKKDRLDYSKIVEDMIVRDCLKRIKKDIRERNGDFLVPEFVREFVREFYRILKEIKYLDLDFNGVETVLKVREIEIDYTRKKERIFDEIDGLDNPLYDKEYIKDCTDKILKIIDKALDNFHDRVKSLFGTGISSQEDMDYLIKMRDSETFNWIKNYSEQELKGLVGVNLSRDDDKLDEVADYEDYKEVSGEINGILGISDEDITINNGEEVMCGFDSIDGCIYHDENDEDFKRFLEEEKEFEDILEGLEKSK